MSSEAHNYTQIPAIVEHSLFPYREHSSIYVHVDTACFSMVYDYCIGVVWDCLLHTS